MRKKSFLLPVIALLTVGCSKDRDMFIESNVELTNAETQLKTKIDDNHDWTLIDSRSIYITKHPTDIQATAVAIFDKNPLLDSTATVIGYSSKLVNSLAYSTPKHLGTAFVGCLDDRGDVRIMNVGNTGTVDFTKKAETNYVEKTTAKGAASRFATPKRIKNSSELVWKSTLHAKRFSKNGWNDQWAYVEQGDLYAEFTNLRECQAKFMTVMGEGKQNYHNIIERYTDIKDCTYAVVGNGGGEVSVTPIYRNASVKNSRIGYYYILPNEEADIKTVNKYVFEQPIPYNMVDDPYLLPDSTSIRAYRLIYYDKNGKPSYKFPEGTKIGFFNVRGEYKGFDNEDFFWYNDGEANLDIASYMKKERLDDAMVYANWDKLPHTVMFQYAGTSFIGFEDWMKDFDMNDVVLTLRGNIVNIPVMELQIKNTHYYTYAFEDTRNGDYDMNDVVLRVHRPNLNEAAIKVELVAVGTENQVRVYYYDPNGNKTIALFDNKEVHQVFRDMGEASTYINTQGVNAREFPSTMLNINPQIFSYAKADFSIVNETKNLTIHLPAAVGQIGGGPLAICLPNNWAWPKEGTSISKAYGNFIGYAANRNVNLSWYLYPEAEHVINIE